MNISQTTQAHSVAVASKSGAVHVNKEASQSKPASSSTDTVQISSAAKKAFQEATETPTQTAKEARSGDLQAKHLLAKEQASAEEAKESSAERANEAQVGQKTQGSSMSSVEQ